MDSRSEARIQKEIRKRAFQRADVLRQERQLNIKTQHTLAALQDVTGLPQPELDSIADGVKFALQGPCDNFFTIKRQILIAAGIFSSVFMLTGLLALI